MARNHLIRQLLENSQQAQTALYNMMESNRKQGADVTVHLREQHFITATAECKRNTMTELAQMLHITPGAATQLAARLEHKGLLTREKSSADHRVTLVHLTPAGKEIYDRLKSEARRHSRKASQVLEQFTDEELALLVRYEQLKQSLYAD